MLQQLLIINIICGGVAVLGVLMSIFWSRAVRGFWPSRKKIAILSAIFVGIWLLQDVFYFYLKFRNGQL
jgi:hypothetical protein